MHKLKFNTRKRRFIWHSILTNQKMDSDESDISDVEVFEISEEVYGDDVFEDTETIKKKKQIRQDEKLMYDLVFGKRQIFRLTNKQWKKIVLKIAKKWKK
jgi:hypothetical protein